MQTIIPKITDLASRQLQSFISEPVVVGADDPVSEIIGKIVTNRLSEVLVQGSRPGIVTLRSIMRAGEESDRRASTLTVTPPVTTQDDTVSKAAKIMSQMRVRSLPIVDLDGKLKGAVLSSSILQQFADLESSGRKVFEIMTSRPVTVDFSDNLDKARSVMVERDFDHLPVTRDGKLAGLITSLDIVSVMGPTEKRGRSSKLPEPSSKGIIEVGRILRDAPVTNKPGDDIFQVLRTILGQGRTCSIIVEDGTIRGIVTLRDFTRLLAIEPELKGLPISVVGLPEREFESSQAEAKFRRSVEALSHVYQGISEARAIVKASSLEKDRRRYEVQVQIRVPGEQFDFTEEGWSVADVFEKIGEKLKRLMTKPRDKRSHRRHQSRMEMESSRFAE
jgi:CBS domain-containing protein/ribosome-associated translation inhibitor RaiA